MTRGDVCDGIMQVSCGATKETIMKLGDRYLRSKPAWHVVKTIEYCDVKTALLGVSTKSRGEMVRDRAS